MEHDALEAHARDEIGITSELSARPLQTAIWSAAAFFAGAVAPVLAAGAAPVAALLWVIPLISIGLLGLLDAVAAAIGGAPVVRGTIRMCLWGTLAMGLTVVVGHFFGDEG